ncbi:hypothetical protein [Chryseobacterium sp. CH21]|uniref:hypothetical protein n=1 Tax=Chryseobacterium sp. CH21 TaxID=713556 RepID=UPI00100AA0EB|nr:hypothetical protein [Chryseobacterium sp. CH21]
MEKRIISQSHQMKNELDDDYTLFDDGTVLHEYDHSKYPGQYNLKETLNALDLKDEIKQRLIRGIPDEDIELAKQLLGI